MNRRTAVTAALAASAAPTPLRAQPGEARNRALITAAARGQTDEVRRLLADGASVQARDASGRTALLAATYGNHVEVARLLMQAGADVNAQDQLLNSTFLLAGAEGLLEILELALAHGADLRSINRYGGTALIPACHHGHVAVVRRLLATAINVDHINRLGWTALLETVILGDGGAAHTEIARLLVARGANVNIGDREGITPLQHARNRGQTAIIGILEAAGAR